MCTNYTRKLECSVGTPWKWCTNIRRNWSVRGELHENNVRTIRGNWSVREELHENDVQTIRGNWSVQENSIKITWLAYIPWILIKSTVLFRALKTEFNEKNNVNIHKNYQMVYTLYIIDETWNVIQREIKILFLIKIFIELTFMLDTWLMFSLRRNVNILVLEFYSLVGWIPPS